MRFSIGIPAFKARFLYDCIASVLGQTYTDFELIIVNDASPEDVEGVVNNFSDKRIRYYVNEKNYGAENVVDNWNKCLSYALGDYFVLMGDDDLMMPNYMYEFSKLIDRYPNVNVFHCRTKEIDENSNFRTIHQNLPEWESVFDLMLNRLARNRGTFISDFVYKTKHLRNNGGFYKLPLAWASDDITSYIAAKDNGIIHTNECLFCYRRHSRSITSAGAVLKKLEAIVLEKEWYFQFLSECEARGTTEQEVKNVLISLLNQCISKRQALAIGLITKGPKLRMFLSLVVKRTKLGLSIKTLIYSIFISIKYKLNGRPI